VQDADEGATRKLIKDCTQILRAERDEALGSMGGALDMGELRATLDTAFYPPCAEPNAEAAAMTPEMRATLAHVRKNQTNAMKRNSASMAIVEAFLFRKPDIAAFCAAKLLNGGRARDSDMGHLFGPITDNTVDYILITILTDEQFKAARADELRVLSRDQKLVMKGWAANRTDGLATTSSPYNGESSRPGKERRDEHRNGSTKQRPQLCDGFRKVLETHHGGETLECEVATAEDVVAIATEAGVTFDEVKYAIECTMSVLTESTVPAGGTNKGTTGESMGNNAQRIGKRIAGYSRVLMTALPELGYRRAVAIVRVALPIGLLTDDAGIAYIAAARGMEDSESAGVLARVLETEGGKLPNRT
jgi:hypothetical protein